ncbi:MAG: hypothetical protein ABSF44_08750 [Candidatus Bathyarchaeia archaeon]
MSEESDPCARIVRFLKENPEYLTVLNAAISHEKNNEKTMDFKGWEWDDVRIQPQRLVKLVTEGLIDRTYKSKRKSLYKLHDPENVKLAIDKIEKEISTCESIKTVPLPTKKAEQEPEGAPLLTYDSETTPTKKAERVEQLLEESEAPPAEPLQESKIVPLPLDDSETNAHAKKKLEQKRLY